MMSNHRLFALIFILFSWVNITYAEDYADLLKAEINAIDGDPSQIEFTLTNTSTDTTAKFLSWSTPLEGRLTQSLFEVKRDGELLPYRGRVVRRAAPTEADYLTLTQGQSVTKTIDLTQSYDFSLPGEYCITYQAQLSNLQLFDKTNQLQYDGQDKINLISSPTIDFKLQ